MHIAGFEPTLSLLRIWIMSPLLSTTQPYMQKNIEIFEIFDILEI